MRSAGSWRGAGRGGALWAAAYQTALMLKVRVVFLLPDAGSISVKAGYPPEDTLDEADLAAATWAWENNRPARPGPDTRRGRRGLRPPARGRVAVPADADRPRCRRGRGYRQRQPRAAAHARPAPPA